MYVKFGYSTWYISRLVFRTIAKGCSGFLLTFYNRSYTVLKNFNSILGKVTWGPVPFVIEPHCGRAFFFYFFYFISFESKKGSRISSGSLMVTDRKTKMIIVELVSASVL